MLLTIFDSRKLFHTVQEAKTQPGIIIMAPFREGKKNYRLVYTRRHYAGIAFSLTVCCVQLDFIFLGPFPTRDLQTFRNRARYFWRTACCLIPGISRIKFTLLKKKIKIGSTFLTIFYLKNYFTNWQMEQIIFILNTFFKLR